MKRLNRYFFSASIVSLGLTALLSACGGGEEKRISVVQELPNLSLAQVLPGSAASILERMRRAGANVENSRCGSLYNGGLLNVGGSPRVDLVLEIRESQVPLAIAAGFFVYVGLDETTKAELDRKVSRGFTVYYDNGIIFTEQPFDCASRGL